MVEMADDEAPGMGLRQLVEQGQQHHGIETAGDSHESGGTGREQTGGLDGGVDAGTELVHKAGC